MRRRQGVFACVALCVLLLGWVVPGVAQVNTATLSGTVTDPQGLAVRGAKVTVTKLGTGLQRTTVVDEGGRYSLVGLPPGEYNMTVDGGANFATYENPSVVLTVGQDATLHPRLELRTQSQTVTVTTETSPIETSKSDVSQTVEQRRIEGLPINGRNYINFTLTNSQSGRDVAPSIGPAPTSGLIFGGQRARSNMVSVDGADAVDNSVNGIRATVSQEAVQEFQLILSNYNAEYGRATGGVVNIVTKAGGNDVHGNVFGFLRNKAFQARNAFSGELDANGNLVPTKQAYTRVQAGATLGGAFKKDKTFYFFSYEDTLREETGFSSIGAGNFGLSPFSCGTGCPLNNLLLTPGQATATGALLQAAQAAAGGGNFALAAALQKEAGGYALLMGSASGVALQKTDPGVLISQLSGTSLSPLATHQEFPFPVPCPAGQTVNAEPQPGGYPGIACTGGAAVGPGGLVVPAGVVPLPGSYVGLNSLRGNYPITEKTSLWSARLDQRWNNQNTSFLRVGVSPSFVTGLQSTSQNQVFGENAGSRVGVNQSRDVSGVFQHDTIVSNSAFNEFRFQFARRGVHFGYSNLPGGSNIGVNITGVAYFGREPYSPVDRIERRWEWTDQVTLVRGQHSFKMGGDINIVQLRSSKPTIFQLDFGGDVNFGGLSAGTFLFDCVNPATAANHVGSCSGSEIALPGTTAVQSYGLGIPTTYIQGIGAANRPFDNLPFAFFFQDSWHLGRNRRLTLNYGVRYDVEITPLFPAGTPVNQAAEKALGIVEGIPRDYKNVAPRIGLAWDPKGDGKTVIRAGYGLFYDHPLLAVAFDALTVDGGQSVQLISPGSTPSACGLIPGSGVCGAGDSPLNLNGASIFQGALNASQNMFYLPNQQRFDPFGQGSIFANQNFLNPATPLAVPLLPFNLPVSKNFKYGYAQQANLTVEREIAGSWKFSLAYQYTHGVKLYRAVDINSTDPQLLDTNFAKAILAGLPVSNPITMSVPTSGYGGTCGGLGQNIPGGGSIALSPVLPAPFAVQGFTGPDCSGTPLGFIGTPAFFNFFRPSGPNPSFAAFLAPGQPLAVGYAAQVALAQLAGFPVGKGVPVAWNSVDAQLSNGNSIYHGLTFNMTKRFSKGFELLSSYTWSHTIDDSADLQSTLEPADSRFPNLERSNSDNDQRHRWVNSAVFQTPAAKSGEGAWKHFVGNFTFAPIIEVASGHPFNVITGGDSRLDLGTSQARPSVTTAGGVGNTSKYVPGVTFTVATVCKTNSFQDFKVPGITDLGLGCIGNLGRNRFLGPGFFQMDLRVAKRVPLGERWKLDLIADGFNLLNRNNIAAVSQLCNPSAGVASTCTAGQPTASYDARQFQFALKVSW